MKMSIIKKKSKSVYEMYLKDMQAHSHHSCILSRHVKGYENLQCAADRNLKSGANTGSTSGTATTGQGKGLQLCSSGSSAGAAVYCLCSSFNSIISYTVRFESAYILCLYTAFRQDKLKTISTNLNFKQPIS